MKSLVIPHCPLKMKSHSQAFCISVKGGRVGEKAYDPLGITSLPHHLPRKPTCRLEDTKRQELESRTHKKSAEQENRNTSENKEQGHYGGTQPNVSHCSIAYILMCFKC